MKTIEEATDIIPEAVAQTVVERTKKLIGRVQFSRFINETALCGYLVGRAEEAYQSNQSFRKKIDSRADGGDRAISHLTTRMQNWTYDKIVDAFYQSPDISQILQQAGFTMRG